MNGNVHSIGLIENRIHQLNIFFRSILPFDLMQGDFHKSPKTIFILFFLGLIKFKQPNFVHQPIGYPGADYFE